MPLKTVTASNVKPRALNWLWLDHVPLGSVTLLAGDGGLGKSTLTVALAAMLSRGELDGDLLGHPAASYLLSVEDDAQTTIVPRLIAAGADLDLVHLATGDAESVPTLPDDQESLAETITAVGARLVVLDPLSALLSTRIDSWKDQRVRRAMAPLAQLARETDSAVVGIMHLNRRDTQSASARISGSPAFRNAARSVLIFGPDPKEPASGRIIAQEKANLARPDVRSIACRIESVRVSAGGTAIETSKIVLIGESDETAQSVLSPDTAPNARDWLQSVLRNGPRRAQDIQAMAAEFNFTRANLRTARQSLAVDSKRQGGIAADGYWEWSLPERTPE